MEENTDIHRPSTKKRRRHIRIDLSDSLRGLSLLAIVLLCNLEHYNLFYIPTEAPQWLMSLDKGVGDTLFFLFGETAYAAFSLFWGFSYFIKSRNQESRGGASYIRFAWRMLILALISQLHALFFNGDILLLYSIVGLTLIPASKLSKRTLFIIALLCLLQPIEWMRLIYGYFNPEATTYGLHFMRYADLCEPVMRTGGFFETLQSNITHGQLYNNLWQIENGRVFQSVGLFMMGILLGRKRYFMSGRRSSSFWKKALLMNSMLFIPFFLIQFLVIPELESPIIYRSAKLIITTYLSFSQMTIMISLLVLLWFRTGGTYFQWLMIPYGRMSLTNYVTQSIIGVSIYYAFGLGLYQYTGATLSLFIGISIFILQLFFSRYWLSTHRQGPIEWLWRKLTWIL